MSRSQVYAHAKNRFLTCLRARQAGTHNIQLLAFHTHSSQEHNKRVWSAVYSVCEPNLFASGSDDCTGWCAISLYSYPYFLSSLLFPVFVPSSPSLLLPPFLSSSLVPYSTVKFWCVNRPHSIFSMGTKASVWCLQFRPAHQYHMAYGSAGIHSLTLVKKSTT